MKNKAFYVIKLTLNSDIGECYFCSDWDEDSLDNIGSASSLFARATKFQSKREAMLSVKYSDICKRASSVKLIKYAPTSVTKVK